MKTIIGRDGFIPALWEPEAGGWLWVEGQLNLRGEFQGSHSYRVRTCQNKMKSKEAKEERKQKRLPLPFWKSYTQAQGTWDEIKIREISFFLNLHIIQ